MLLSKNFCKISLDNDNFVHLQGCNENDKPSSTFENNNQLIYY